jgi:hypothetical protein
MNTHLLMESVSTANPTFDCKVSRKKLRERAVQLAALDGRAPQDAGKADWEMAKIDLIGEPEQEPEPKAPSDSAVQYGSSPAFNGNAQTPSWLS